MPSRKISDLTLEMQDAFQFFRHKADLAGVQFLVTSTYRSQEEQDALYRQGRTTPGKIVTWTHHSRHTERDAFDVCVLKQGKPVWDVKVDVDEDDIPDYLELGQIGESVGLEWGGRFKGKDGKPQPDYPHFQMRRQV